MLYPAELWRVVVPEARLELAILTEVDFKSTVYAIPPLGDIYSIVYISEFVKFGTPAGIRTPIGC